MNPADPFGLVGQVIDGQLRIDRVVGEGGFSIVYRGVHLGLNESIAIKCLKLPPALGQSLVETFVKRFRDESRILYRLSQGNLNIVRSLAAGSTFSPSTGLVVPYMALEWLDGRSLASDFVLRRSQRQRGRSLQEVLRMFGPAADALGFAHKQRVVHRDLNPGNLFLARTQQGERMKVLDFGVAKVMHDSTLNLGPRAQTMNTVRIFSPAYGAPEQFDESLGAPSPATDVYAFALVLLEALRDVGVNEGVNLADYVERGTDPHRRPTARSLGLDVPDDVEKVFVRATALDPRARWANVGEMWSAFHLAVETQRRPLVHPPKSRETMRQGGGGQTTALPKVPQIRPVLKAPPPRTSTAPRAPTPVPPRATPSIAQRRPMQPPTTPFAFPPPRAAIDSEEEIETRVGMTLPELEHEHDDVTRVAKQVDDAFEEMMMKSEPPPAAAPKAARPQLDVQPPEDGGTLVMASPLLSRQPAAQTPARRGTVPPRAQPQASHAPAFQPLPAQPSFTPPPPAAAPFAPQTFQPSRVPPPPSQAQQLAPAQAQTSPPLIALAFAAAMLFLGIAGLAAFAFTGRLHRHPAVPPAAPSAEPAPPPPASSEPPAPAEEPPPVAAIEEDDDDARLAAVEPLEADAVAPPATTTLSAIAPGPPPPFAPVAAPFVVASVVDSGGPPAWDEKAARAQIAGSTANVASCRRPGGKTGPGVANVTFTPDGAVLNISLDAPYGWTAEGECVAKMIRGVKLEPFRGPSQTIRCPFELPAGE